jgi:hypothetical protein
MPAFTFASGIEAKEPPKKQERSLAATNAPITTKPTTNKLVTQQNPSPNKTRHPQQILSF